MMTVSPSETASTSISIAPSKNLSIKTGLSGEASTASSMYLSSISSEYMICIARPPSTYEGRTKRGKPIFFAACTAPRTDVAVPKWGLSISSLSNSAPKRFRSSARSMLSGDVPKILTPAFCKGKASFKGVCPPNCTITPSGCSASITFIVSSKVKGSK